MAPNKSTFGCKKLLIIYMNNTEKALKIFNKIVNDLPTARILEEISIDDIVKCYHCDDILIRMNVSDIEDFLSDYRFIAQDEYDAIGVLTDDGLIKETIETNDKGIYKDDAIDLITDIVEREGWNYLYNLLEEQKTKLNLL